MDLKQEFPKLMQKINEDIDELRYLIVVDENYEDIDDEEVDIFDPEDYNFLVYITPRVQNAIGSLLQELPQIIEKEQIFENFVASEDDLFGVKYSGLDSEVVVAILKLIEERL